METKLSSKGQVIIPKAVRDAHGWGEGTEFVVEDRPDGVMLRPRKPFRTTTLADVVGSAQYKGPSKSVEEMSKAIDDERAARWKRKGSKS